MSTLYIFTEKFPFGSGETFLESEVPVLAREFAEVVICPFEPDGPSRTIPPNCKVRPATPYRESLGLWLKSVTNLSRVVLADVPNSRRLMRLWHDLRCIRSVFLRCVHLSLEVESFVPRTAIAYSYWNNDWALALALASRRFVTRAHGYDINESRARQGVLPYLGFKLVHALGVYCVAEEMQQRLVRTFPRYADKFHLARLGVRDHGESLCQPREEFQVVSCSNVIPLKRVHLIAGALAKLDFPVNWIHFGGGPEFETLRNQVGSLPPHIRVEVRGYVPNATVLGYYASQHVDVFVNVSSTEGLPVSIMEAYSFGIPVVATRVGGTPEIVEADLLIDAADDDSVRETLRQKLSQLHSRPLTVARRREIRLIWEREFSAETNYPAFAAAVRTHFSEGM